MTTNEFIAALRKAPEDQLIFVNDAGHAIHAGYHLTEIKAAHFDTVDCGGQTNRWNETVVQLWVPADADDEYMTVAKFLRIFDKVTGMIPLQAEAEIRVEYGDRNFFPSLYHVKAVGRENGTTRVLLQPPGSTCKARDRWLNEVETAACCQSEAVCC
jgi:methylphosphotriester-DNA--protein-cysteine methyltransferase